MSSSENGWFRSLAVFFEDSSFGSVVQGFQDDIFTLSSYGNATDEGKNRTLRIIFLLFTQQNIEIPWWTEKNYLFEKMSILLCCLWKKYV